MQLYHRIIHHLLTKSPTISVCQSHHVLFAFSILQETKKKHQTVNKNNRKHRQQKQHQKTPQIMRSIGLLLLLLIHLTGIVLFCLGFFPSKVVLQGFNIESGEFDAKFDKLVVMVVDALRSDFLFSDKSSMSFVHSLINKKSALGFTAYSNPPTVTLPRLKGITTGSTPNFLDAVLNVVEGDESSILSSQDSWLKQLKLADKTIHFFGDDTWLKLFPGLFDKTDGTSSFFVADFTEVDNNVTRHLEQELNDQTWDCLILHYLGLDHIGHKGGPESVFMKPKQKEMDSIIERIYSQLDEDTLFVVLGDHGMNEIGNHGGSSIGETSAGLLFISDKFQKIEQVKEAPIPHNDEFDYFRNVQQIDLVPTISSLLNLPIPKNSLGIFIKEFLSLWDDESQRSNVLIENSNHLKNFKEFDVDELSEDQIYSVLYDIQSELTKSATNYDLKLIYIGLGISLFATTLSIILAINEFGFHSLLFTSFIITYSVCSFGSSLVEEEHQLWWWFATLFVAIFAYRDKIGIVLLLGFIRLLRGWNASGQKYIGDTILDYLQSHNTLNWGLVIITISAYAFNLNNGGLSLLHSGVSFGISFLLSIILLTFKLLFSIANGDAIPSQLINFVAYSIDALGVKTAQEGLVPVARMFLGVLGVAFIIRIGAKFRGFNLWFFNDLHNLIAFLLIFQTSLNNIGIFLILLGVKLQFGLISSNYQKINRLDKIGYISLSVIILQNLSFFSFGQTNSLASIDLSNAYNGVTSYNILSTGVLTFLTNFAGPIYWSFGSLGIIFENRENLRIVKYEILEARWITNLLFFTISTFFILTSCFVQRYHLFIWTVFSPKVLYTIAWNFFVNGGVELVIGGVIALY